MTPDETNQLIRQWQDHNDHAARDRLVRQYRRLLRGEARRAVRLFKYDFDDAYQLAAIAFLNALDKYEFGHGANLLTFCYRHVRKEMARHLDTLDVVKRPNYQFAEASIVNKVKRDLRRRGIEPTIEAIATRANLSVGRVQNAMFQVEAVPEEDWVWADEGPNPEEALEASREHARVHAAIDQLPVRQAAVVRMRFIEEKGVEEIGQELGVTKQAVSLMVQRSMVKLRDLLGAAA